MPLLKASSALAIIIFGESQKAYELPKWDNTLGLAYSCAVLCFAYIQSMSRPRAVPAVQIAVCCWTGFYVPSGCVLCCSFTLSLDLCLA